MSVAIVGEGVAGLSTACFIKERHPDVPVYLVGGCQGSNSAMAGQRYRLGLEGTNGEEQNVLSVDLHCPQTRDRLRNEMHDLLAARVPDDLPASQQLAYKAKIGQLTENAAEGAVWLQDTAGVELAYKPVWFGPQAGSAHGEHQHGRGADVLRRLKKYARSLGCLTVPATLTGIERHGSAWDMTLEAPGDQGLLLTSDTAVLATGSPTGRIFKSSNTNLRHTGLALLQDRYPLHGLSEFMIHPFGRADSNGDSRRGCLATDDIADAEVFIDGQRAEDVEEMLVTHTAHGEFDYITSRFIGKTVLVKVGDKTARVQPAIHYWQAGLTPAGDSLVRVDDGLYAAGEVGNTGRYVPGVRLPGLALSVCLSDARLIGREIKASRLPAIFRDVALPERRNLSCRQLRQLQAANTDFVLGSGHRFLSPDFLDLGNEPAVFGDNEDIGLSLRMRQSVGDNQAARSSAGDRIMESA